MTALQRNHCAVFIKSFCSIDNSSKWIRLIPSFGCWNVTVQEPPEHGAHIYKIFLFNRQHFKWICLIPSFGSWNITVQEPQEHGALRSL